MDTAAGRPHVRSRRTREGCGESLTDGVRKQPSLAAILDELRGRTGRPVRAVVRAGSAGLTLLAVGPWLAWLPLDLLDRLPGTPLRALPLAFGRRRYRAGFVARRSAESLLPFRPSNMLCATPRSGAQAPRQAARTNLPTPRPRFELLLFLPASGAANAL